MTETWRRLLGALLPSSCHACGAELRQPPASPPRCNLLCPSCCVGLRPIAGEEGLGEGIVLLSAYRPGFVPLALIKGLKYAGRDAALSRLSGDMARRLQDCAWPRPWLLVPVPLPPLRRLTRGFNQSELLARRVARICGLPRPRSLLRRRLGAGRQAARSRSQRLLMASQEYSLRRVAPAEGTLILVDDLCTTGATLRACARALDPEERRLIGALVLLRVPPQARGSLSLDSPNRA